MIPSELLGFEGGCASHEDADIFAQRIRCQARKDVAPQLPPKRGVCLPTRMARWKSADSIWDDPAPKFQR